MPLGRQTRLLPEQLWQDLRYAARGLQTSPGFAALVVATLALGIGANATMFGVVDRLMLRPPAHVHDADRVVRVQFQGRRPAGEEYTSPSSNYPTFAAIRDRAPAFERVAAYFPAHLSLGRGPEAREVKALLVTGDYFRLLGVCPAAGRFFTAAEDRLPAGSPVAVLGHGLWRSRFGGDSSVVGSAVRFGAGTYTVIGVAPPEFTGIDLDRVDVWLPMSAAAGDVFIRDWAANWGSYWLSIVARVRPGASPALAAAQATAALATVQRMPSPFPKSEVRVALDHVIAARGAARSPEARVSTWLAGVSALVLLVACANVANLLLARAVGRRREIAVRLALGIGRGRLVRQLLVEGVLLALLGAGAALVIAAWGGQVLRAVLLPNVAWLASPVDGRVLAFSAAAALVTGVLVTLAPAWQATAPDLTTALRAGAPGGDARWGRLRSGLVVAQVALSVVLLVGAGLFVRSLRNVRALDLGADVDRVIVATMSLPESGFTPGEIEGIYAAALERVRALPGVHAAAVAQGNPFMGGMGTGPGTPERPDSVIWPRGEPVGWRATVSPGFFAAVGTPVLRGRELTASDVRGAPRVAVINAAMARKLWPGEDALGRCMYVARNRECTTVVGVASDAWKFRILEAGMPHVYLPFAQDSATPGSLFVRTAGDPRSLLGRVRREVQGLRGDLPYAQVQLMEELIAPQLRPWRLGASMFLIFGLLALAISAVGLYGVVAYLAAQRTREIGVRMALGARAKDVVRLVVRDGLRDAAIGLVVGVAATLAAGRFVASLLFGVRASDPASLVLAGAVLLVVAALAALVPAWRAAHVDPTVALRAE